MVIDRDGRPVIVVAKDAVNDGISLFSPVNLDLAAVALDCCNRKIDAFSDVVCMARIDRDRGNLNETLQKCFKLLSMRIGKRQQTVPFQCRGHSESSVELSCESLRPDHISKQEQIAGPDHSTAREPCRCLLFPQATKCPLGASENFVRRPCVHSKGSVLHVILAFPCFLSETRPDG